MAPRILIEGYQAILRTIYSPSEYYQRALESLRRVPKDGPAPHRFSVIGGLVSLMRIALKLGIIDSERREFWHYFGRVWTNHREKFAESMRLAAMGYHFRMLVKAYSD